MENSWKQLKTDKRGDNWKCVNTVEMAVEMDEDGWKLKTFKKDWEQWKQWERVKTDFKKNCWNWLKMVENSWKWLKMVENSWKWLKQLKMVKQLKTDETGLKLKTGENGWNWWKRLLTIETDESG